MSLQGQRQSLEALLGLKARIAIKQSLLLRQQQILQAESETLEGILRRGRYQESMLMQSNLATDAVYRLTGLSERLAAQNSVTNPEATLNEEFFNADKRFNARMVLAEGALFRADEESFGVLKATQILDGRREFIHALHQYERQEAILKWVGEAPELIAQWKKQKWPLLDAHAADDLEREAILTAGEQMKADDSLLKAAKARYLTFLSEVTLLADQVRYLESLLSATQAERQQVDRQAKAESHMLATIYAQQLFHGKSELEAYQLASEALAAAREIYSKRLDSARQNALGFERTQIDALLDRAYSIDPDSAKRYRGRMDKALSDSDVDGLAQIRRELAQLTELADQARNDDQAHLATIQLFEQIQDIEEQEERSRGGEEIRNRNSR
jgi:hypothetical protein